MLGLCREDVRFVRWMQAHKMGPRLIHFFMQKDSKMEEILPSYPLYTSSEFKLPVMRTVFEIIALLLPYEADLKAETEET